MNINELIELLWRNAGEGETPIRQAAAMLRQQQAEIEALRNQLWDFKSEPWGFDRHPVKELTDEEIVDAWNEDWMILGRDEKFIKFARAILRKAQEK